MASFDICIKTEREKKILSQTEFGPKIGINSSAITRMENRTQNISNTKLVNLLEIFKMDLQILVDIFYADKFAREICDNNCSKNLLIMATITAKDIQVVRVGQSELKSFLL